MVPRIRHQQPSLSHHDAGGKMQAVFWPTSPGGGSLRRKPRLPKHDIRVSLILLRQSVPDQDPMITRITDDQPLIVQPDAAWRV